MDTQPPDILAPELRQYLLKTLGVPCEFQAVPALQGVKIGIKNHYLFLSTTLHGVSLLLCLPKDQDSWTPLQSRKDFATLELAGFTPVLVLPAMSAASRERLIEYGISFIDPGKQLHLPRLLVSLREYGFGKRPPLDGDLTPAAQHMLLSLYLDARTPSHQADWEHHFQVSRMTVHRAITELKALDAISIHKEARRNHISLAHASRDGFLELASKLRAPTEKTIHLAELPDHLRKKLIPAGHNALAACSDLMDDPVPTYAVGKDVYQDNAELINDCACPDEAQAKATLEIWRYAPVTAQGGIDKLSVYLSLRNHQDERIQSALEQLLDSITWPRD